MDIAKYSSKLSNYIVLDVFGRDIFDSWKLIV